MDGTQTSRILYENDVILKDIIGDFYWLISFGHNLGHILQNYIYVEENS